MPSNVEWVVRKLLSVSSYILSPRRKLGSQGAAQMASVRNKCKIGGNINHNCKWEVLVIAPRVRTRLNITLDIRLTAFKFRYLYKSRLKLLFSIYSVLIMELYDVGHG